MPEFQLSIPEGFLFIPANLSFLSFCFFVSFIFFRVFRSKLVFFITWIALVSFVYSDFLLKQSVKLFYTTTNFNSGVLSKATKNEDGKIDSLSTIKIYQYPLSYSSSLSSSKQEEIASIHENYISKFIDVSTYRYKFNKYFYNQERIFLNAYKYDNSFLNDVNQKARFTITLKEKKNTFFDFYKEYQYSFIDTYTNEILAKAYYLKFEISTNKLRNRYLYWTKEKEEEFNPSSIQNFDEIYRKVFIDE